MTHFYLLAFSNFFFFLGNSFFHLFPIYMDQIGATSTYIGIIMGLTSGISVFMTWGYRNKIDFINKKNFLLYSGIFSLLIYFGYYVQSDLYTIPVLRFFQGFIYSIGFTFGAAFAVDLVPVNKRAGFIGLFGISGALTNAVGPTLAEKLLEYFPFKILFLLAGATAFISIVCVYFIRFKKEKPTIQSDLSSHIKEYKKIIPLSLLLGAFFSTFFSFISHYAKELSVQPIAYFYVGYTLVLILVRIFFNEKLNTWKREKIIPITVMIGVFGLVLACLLKSFPIVLILGLIGVSHGIAHGLLYPSLNVLFVDATPHRSGKATLIFILFFNFGSMLASFIYGFIADLIGYNWMYLVSALISLLLFFIFYDKKEIQRLSKTVLDDEDQKTLKVQ